VIYWIETFFAQHSNKNADLWKGGKPIQNSMMQKYWSDIWGDDWEPVYTYDSE
jgi:hypothetical protein